LSACNNKSEELPTSLEGRMKVMSALKEEMAGLEALIQEVQDSINVLSPKTINKRPVTVITPKKSDFKHYISVQGSIISDDMVNVSSDLGGRVLDMKVKEGQKVRKGAVIAKLDLENLQKQRAELEKSLELAAEVFVRQQRLWEQNIGSEIQFLQAKNNKERLEKSLETLDFNAEKSNVFAPISGSILRVNIKAGELAGPGMPLVTILNTNKVKVSAEVPESYIKAVKKGDKIAVELPALAEERNAKISLIGDAINPANRTFKIEAVLTNADKLLKPNLLANVKLNDYTKKDAISIPVELVQQEVGGKSFVFVINMGKAEKTFVSTGEVQDGMIIITEGLTGEEQLIKDGARNIVNGELVEIKG
jgi:RND family efflux transporter MFP subunit